MEEEQPPPSVEATPMEESPAVPAVTEVCVIWSWDRFFVCVFSLYILRQCLSCLWRPVDRERFFFSSRV